MTAGDSAAGSGADSATGSDSPAGPGADSATGSDSPADSVADSATGSDSPADSVADSATDSGADSGADSARTAPPAGPDGSARVWIGRAILALGLLVLLSFGWVGWRTYQAYHHLNAAADQVSSLQQQIANLGDIDLDKANAAVASLRAEADDSVSATSDPLYRLAGHLPWLGPNLRAVSVIAGTVDGLATTTAPALLQVAQTVQPAALAPKNGAIDIRPIAAASGTLEAADAAVTAAGTRIAAIDRSRLAGPIARAVDTLAAKLAKLNSTTAVAARIGRLAPPMLGNDGPRKYLVIFQNLAEPRATGGLPGTFVLLVIDKGKLTITDQGSGSRVLGTFDPPLAMPPNLPAVLYGVLPGQFESDVNLTPDFPTAASLLAKMYAVRKSVQVDGVLAIDPVAMSYLLVGAQPIAIGHGLSVTSDNITEILLSEAYRLYPRVDDLDARDVFLAGAASSAFDALTGQPANAGNMIAGLARASAEHRLLMWSAHPGEQEDLAGTELTNLMPGEDGATPTIGVFRDDATGAKLGYYSSGAATVTAGSCDADSRRALTVTLNMAYSAPSSGLPPYVIGFAKAGPYVLRTNVMIFGPIGGDVTSVMVDGKPTAVAWATESGRKVGMVTVDEKPGQPATVVATLTAPAAASLAPEFTPRVVLTPGVTTWAATVPTYPAC